MPLQFKPKNEEELMQGTLLESGQYEFEVIEALEKISSKGNQMIHLKIKILNDGKQHIIYDYLVATDNMMFKIKHFCETASLRDKYAKGSLSCSDCLGKKGLADIDLQEAEGTYSAKNFVVDYIPSEDYALVDDDIPF